MTANNTIDSTADLINDPSGSFEALWAEFGIPTVRQVGDSWVTPAYNQGALERRLHATADELEERGVEDPRVYRGMGKRAILNAKTSDDRVDERTVQEMEQRGVIDRNVAESSTPLVFDPDILAMLKDEAPLSFGRLVRRGQQGYTAVFNRIDDRDVPLGWRTESYSTNLQDKASGISLSRDDVDMKIFVDSATIADFSAQASSHYMNLEELTVGQRMAMYAQWDEQTVLYGDPSTALEGGSPLGPEAHDGLATVFDGAGNQIDKSAVTENFAEDIKAEITEILQGDFASRQANLEVWCSETLKDAIENELGGRARYQFTADGNVEINVGGEDLSVKNDIPLVPSHNVDEHTYYRRNEDNELLDDTGTVVDDEANAESATVGHEGDVFIVNTAAAEVRELAPLSSFPMAVRGAADEIGMVAYSTLIERSGGQWGKHLSAYAV